MFIFNFITLKTMVMMTIWHDGYLSANNGDSPDGFYFYQDNHIDHVMGDTMDKETIKATNPICHLY